MKALAIHQPYAWLIVQGIKDVENRTWSTRHRGPFLVHASKKVIDAKEMSRVRSQLARKGIVLPDDLQRGGIVGVVTLVDCIQRADVRWWKRGRAAQHDSEWFEGPYGFILEDARPLPFRPFRGRQKFFNVPDELYGPEFDL